MILKDEVAVSSVIGLILIVAITVILAAAIAAFVMDMTGSLQKFYVVAATASQVGDDIIVTYHGGPDHVDVLYFNVTSAGSNTSGLPASQLNPSTGYSITFYNHGTNGSNDTIIASAKFKDGAEQVILHTTV